MKNPAPIILFVYNRPNCTRQMITALMANYLAKDTDLYIYSDAAKTPDSQVQVNEVRRYIRTIFGFKSITIIEREKNFGLAENIIDGVTNLLEKYEQIIVLEDDLVVSPHFLEYMNANLEFYKNNKEVACITAFNFPLKYPQGFKDDAFFIRGADCWTWATWKRAWQKFEKDGAKLLAQIQTKNLQKEFDIDGSYPYTKMLQDQIKGKNNSWAIRWYASAFLENMLCLYPRNSLVENIGYDGTHFNNVQKDEFFGKISQTYIQPHKIAIKENDIARRSLFLFYKKRFSILSKIIRKFRSLLRVF